MRIALFLTCLTALVALSATATRAGVYFPETAMLDNGMQVVVVNNPRAPVVSHMVWYRVGAADEPQDAKGIAHFFEHLMFKATDELEAGEFSRIVARNGGRDNAFTSWDYTAYFQSIAADRLGLVMTMEADRMTDLALTEDVVATERAVVREERRQVVGARPARELSEQLYAALYLHHPYGTPILGWDGDIASLDIEDAKAFYRRWYAPDNAILVVSGDVTLDEVVALAEETYGKIPARKVPARARVDLAPLRADARLTLADARVEQPSWRRLYRAPSYMTEGSEHAYALQVLSEILSGGQASRLYRALVAEAQIATSASFFYYPGGLDGTVAGFAATPAPGVDMAVIEAAIEEQIAMLLADGVTQEEVTSAAQRSLASAIYARDSLMGPAMGLGRALVTGQTIADVEAWPERMMAVTPDDVLAAARHVLEDKRHVTGILLPDQTETARADGE